MTSGADLMAVSDRSGTAEVVVLCRARSATERRLCDEWAAGRPGSRLVWNAPEAVATARPGDLIMPVRVAWSGREGSLRRSTAILAGDLSAGLRERLHHRAATQDPPGCSVLVGEPATLAELAARWTERSGRPAHGADFAAFVDRQAAIILDRVECRQRGERYRSPRAVVDEVMTRPSFVEGVTQLGAQLGRSPEGVLADARAYLEEMASEQSRLAVDLWYRWARLLWSGGYQLHVDRAQIEELRRLGASHPLVFLPSHRSNLDPYVLTSVLYENGLPQNHTLGGINMAFWPLGPMGRKVGVVFIRRSMRDNQIYRYVLKQYLGFLVSKRFNLEWYVEGTRSRTGKLLPPRLGLLNYLLDALQTLDRDDVLAVPTSIVYDVLPEARDMTAESRGQVKQGEGLGWLLRYARENRGDLGGIHVRFGEPLNLASALGEQEPPAGSEPDPLARSKVAFEICVRINRASVMSSPAVVLFALLGVEDRALTLDEVAAVVRPVLDYAGVRMIQLDARAGSLRTPEGIEAMLRFLSGHDLVECFDRGAVPVYRIKPTRQLVAAFYRNSIVHWFVARSVVELIVVGRDGDRDQGSLMDEGRDQALRLRDLLKLEFFFPEKEEFMGEIHRELQLVDGGGEDPAAGFPDARAALARSGMLVAHRALRSFLEAYWIVARRMVQLGTDPTDADRLVKDCLDLGQQYRLQQLVGSEEAVSAHLFRNAARLAGQRGLLGGGVTAAAGRAAFNKEIDDVLAKVREIHALERRGPR